MSYDLQVSEIYDVRDAGSADTKYFITIVNKARVYNGQQDHLLAQPSAIHLLRRRAENQLLLLMHC